VVAFARRLSRCTESFAKFIYDNFNKFTAAFEMGILTGDSSGITYERTRVLNILLLAIRVFANAHLPS
jgi:predicted membrane metal-binding protein